VSEFLQTGCSSRHLINRFKVLKEKEGFMTVFTHGRKTIHDTALMSMMW